MFRIWDEAIEEWLIHVGGTGQRWRADKALAKTYATREEAEADLGRIALPRGEGRPGHRPVIVDG